MWAAPRSEPVREPEKVDLADDAQDLADGALDHFVFQRGNRPVTGRQRGGEGPAR